MNYRVMGRFLSMVMLAEIVFMIPALIICLCDGNTTSAWAFVETMLGTGIVCTILLLSARKAKVRFYAREGLVSVGAAWIAMSLVGCMPFYLSGEIPSFVNAFFESVSGFTTTGSTILTDVEALSRGILYWRSFTHWLGGMGVLVFVLIFVPTSGKDTGSAVQLLRAESTGPNVGKLVPSLRQTARILYLLYFALTLTCFILLVCGGMPVFDAICISYGTAGTGGFGVLNDSLASYSTYVQVVVTIFMLLFGVNFTCYYLVIVGRIKDVLKDEEVRMYFGVVIAAIVMIVLNVRSLFDTLGEAVQQVAFIVSSIITTTGFGTVDFDQWPTFSKMILLLLMVCGACAGSTGGGFKCGRVLILGKSLRRGISKILSPNKVQVVSVNGSRVDEKVIGTLNTYLVAYVLITLASFLLVSLDGESVTTTITAVIACFNNIGPGLDAVGPTCNFEMFGVLSKLVLVVDMLAGRLEIFPILILLSRQTWKKVA